MLKNEMNSYCKLAKQAIKHYLDCGEFLKIPKIMEKAFSKKAGVFVSIHIKNELRGCIGTYFPTKENIAEEIVHNSIAAAFDDPRFLPLTANELKKTQIKVDVLSELKKINTTEELNPKKYGILIKSQNKSSLLLPDLEGINSVEQQLHICRNKSMILETEPVDIFKFTVKRYS